MFAKKRQKQIRNLLTLSLSCSIIAYYALNLNLGSLLSASNAPPEQSQQPVSILDDIAIRQFDSEGRLSQQLNAERAEVIIVSIHDDENTDLRIKQTANTTSKPKNKKLRLIQPKVIVREKNDPPLIITAAEGLIGRRGEETKLTGNVKIINSKIEVFTPSLTLDSVNNTLATDQTISIQSPNTTTTATGLKANLNEGQWQLLSGVNSVIQP